jgi:prepilin-type N-terminal cleavage/methylation domain-containing protein
MSCGSIPGPAGPGGPNRPGFTLVESLVALVIAAAITIGAMEAVGAGLRAQGAGNAHLTAVSLAETKLAELTALPADSLSGERTVREGVFPPPFAAYTWRGIIAGEPGSPALRGVGVVVSWPGGEFSLETVVYRRRPPRAPAARGGRP